MNKCQPKRQWYTRAYVSPLRYPGGKRKLAPFIADLISRTNHSPKLFVEPFAGGASVSISLLEAGYVDKIALCDLDPLVASLWNVIFSKDASKLAELVTNAVVTVAEWNRIKNSSPTSLIESAYKCIYLNRTSFSGSLHEKAGPIGGQKQLSIYDIGCRFKKNLIADRIIELSALREKVQFVECLPYQEFIKMIISRYSDSNELETIFWYLDPPYFAKADRLYRLYFTQQDHNELAISCDDLPGNWLLSYDDHKAARELYANHEGFSKVNMTYTARVDENPRIATTEIIVSNVITKLRKDGVINNFDPIIKLPSLRPELSSTIHTIE